MKSNKSAIGRALDQPDEKIRFYLFHGPDEAQSRALGVRLLEGLGASKSILTAASLKSDPASLVDEAAAMSLFGGRRAVRIEPANKDIEEAVAVLLDGSAVENPVIAIAGSLTKSSSLLKLAESSPNALAHVSYAPEGQDAERMVVDVGRRFGLKMAPTVAARLARASDNDLAIVTQEIQKLALYVDASPHTPKELDDDALNELGAESSEGDFQVVADLALSGNMQALCEELSSLPAGLDAIPVVRSLQRRILMLAPARARIERGERVDDVMTSVSKSLFWKHKTAVQAMLRRWSAEDLAKIAERASKLEKVLIFSSVPQGEALGEELFAIARRARTR